MLIFPIVKSKFGLADATDLQIFDETNTAVDEDILLELMESNPDLCLTICDSFLGEGITYLLFLLNKMLKIDCCLSDYCDKVAAKKYVSKMQITIHFPKQLENVVWVLIIPCLSYTVSFVMSTNIWPTVDEDMLCELIKANPDFCLTVCNSIPGTFLMWHRL